MPRFFFTLHDGDRFPDEEGQELRDLDDAREAAVAAAREMMAEEIKAGRLPLRDCISIRDEEGRTLARIDFPDTIEILYPNP